MSRLLLFVHHPAMGATPLATEQSSAIATDIDITAVVVILTKSIPKINKEKGNANII